MIFSPFGVASVSQYAPRQRFPGQPVQRCTAVCAENVHSKCSRHMTTQLHDENLRGSAINQLAGGVGWRYSAYAITEFRRLVHGPIGRHGKSHA